MVKWKLVLDESVLSTLHRGGEGQNAYKMNFSNLVTKVVDQWLNPYWANENLVSKFTVQLPIPPEFTIPRINVFYDPTLKRILVLTKGEFEGNYSGTSWTTPPTNYLPGDQKVNWEKWNGIFFKKARVYLTWILSTLCAIFTLQIQSSTVNYHNYKFHSKNLA